MRTLGLTCLSSTLFLLPVFVTVVVYAGIESQKVLDVLHGKIPLSAMVPTVPRPKGPRVIETDMYCNKSYAILPFPGRYMCKFALSSSSGHPEKKGTKHWDQGLAGDGRAGFAPHRVERRAISALAARQSRWEESTPRTGPSGFSPVFGGRLPLAPRPSTNLHTLAGIHCNVVPLAPKLSDDRAANNRRGLRMACVVASLDFGRAPLNGRAVRWVFLLRLDQTRSGSFQPASPHPIVVDSGSWPSHVGLATGSAIGLLSKPLAAVACALSRSAFCCAVIAYPGFCFAATRDALIALADRTL